MSVYRLSDTIDFSPGREVYEDLMIYRDLALSKQLVNLKEDLLQVEFMKSLVLDVGWFPSFSPQGKFQVRVVQSFDWERPVFFAETRQLDELITTLTAAASLCKALQ